MRRLSLFHPIFQAFLILSFVHGLRQLVNYLFHFHIKEYEKTSSILFHFTTFLNLLCVHGLRLTAFRVIYSVVLDDRLLQSKLGLLLVLAVGTLGHDFYLLYRSLVFFRVTSFLKRS